MALQKETTHICESAILTREYRQIGGVWFYFYNGVWYASGNEVEWHDKNLTPIVNAESQSTTEQDPNGISQHDSGVDIESLTKEINLK